ncbi:50S ribosomal protein L18 [Candidatus Woesearchaeota archaeon]|nr:50S ribosomal protein L18 [Candidatus Woesearchaeota archaeon]
MKRSKTHSVPFRRKREGRTDYLKRISLLKSGKPRLVIRGSLKNTVVQIAEFEPKGDKISVTATTKDLQKFGLKTKGGNIPTSYLVGLLAGKKAIEKGIKEAVVDIGLQISTKGSRSFAAVKGAVDSGLKIAVSDEILPSGDRISGKTIEEYAKSLKDSKESVSFTEYQKNGITPDNISKYFEGIKNKITGGS